MGKIESEKVLEKRLKKEVEDLGGWCLKFVPLHFAGFPDRIVLLPRGVIVFVELKTTKKKPRKLQQNRIDKLKKLGFRVEVVDTTDKILDLFLDY